MSAAKDRAAARDQAAATVAYALAMYGWPENVALVLDTAELADEADLAWVAMDAAQARMLALPGDAPLGDLVDAYEGWNKAALAFLAATRRLQQ